MRPSSSSAADTLLPLFVSGDQIHEPDRAWIDAYFDDRVTIEREVRDSKGALATAFRTGFLPTSLGKTTRRERAWIINARMHTEERALPGPETMSKAFNLCAVVVFGKRVANRHLSGGYLPPELRGGIFSEQSDGFHAYSSPRACALHYILDRSRKVGDGYPYPLARRLWPAEQEEKILGLAPFNDRLIAQYLGRFASWGEPTIAGLVNQLSSGTEVRTFVASLMTALEAHVTRASDTAKHLPAGDVRKLARHVAIITKLLVLIENYTGQLRRNATHRNMRWITMLTPDERKNTHDLLTHLGNELRGLRDS